MDFGSFAADFEGYVSQHFFSLWLKCNQVKLKHGIEMVKIFKDHDARTSILDDFDFYNDREKVLRDRKTRQQAYSTAEAGDSLAHESLHEISNSFAQALQLKESSEIVASEFDAGTRIDSQISIGNDSPIQMSDSQSLGLESGDKEVHASSIGGEGQD